MKYFTTVYPVKTQSVSVTGNKCELNCSHCNRHYLSGMKNLADFITDIPKGCQSVLISGGMNKSGYVPSDEQAESLALLKAKGLRLNLHTGFMPENKIKVISKYTDVVSFDFITDENTLKNVYNLDKKTSDTIQTFENLSAVCRVVPHITIGLLGGKISGEYKAIEQLAHYKPQSLVFLILIPTIGTKYEHCSLPEIENVLKVINFARSRLPDTSFTLGCMRPRGAYSLQLEHKCIEMEFTAIVNPSHKTIKFLEEKNIPIIRKDQCCSL